MANAWRVVSAEEAKAHPLYGVGGWLLLLVAGMTVLGPLLGAGRIGAEFISAERQYPTLVSLDEWNSFKSAIWWNFGAIAALSFYGGWGLARGSGWSVVTRAKVILWLAGPVGALVLGVVVPLATLGKSNAGHGQFVGGLLASVITAGIWTAYLSKSKRVRVTFAFSVLHESHSSESKRHVTTGTSRMPESPTSPSSVAAAFSRNEVAMAEDLEEAFWAEALAEYESSARRPGLWARVFSQAQGNEAVAKANYLKSRVEELSLKQQEHTRVHEQAKREAVEKARLAALSEEQRAYALLPKGQCPNCDAMIPLSAEKCPECSAVFGPESAWKVRPLKAAGS